MSEQNNKIQESIEILSTSNDFKVLRRLPQTIIIKQPTGKVFKAAFIDLETTGFDRNENEIIEIGVLIASFTKEDGFINIDFTDNQLQQPQTPISKEITKITGISNQDVEGKSIDWQGLQENMQDIDIAICHNASFDRQFLEAQTPVIFQKFIQSIAFGCSAEGVNWSEMGYEGKKLEYLNLKMGYFYDGHRALIDCFATLNLFIERPEAFKMLLENISQKEILICAVNARFDKKDELKKRKYRWSNGDQDLPKCWWTSIPFVEYEQEELFLRQEIYQQNQLNLPTKIITAKERYSVRAFAM
jgi:DNA polymerase-3 subunit epsilon